MSAFSDYLDLRTAVVEMVGDAGIADVFDRLTKLAEARFNRDLRTRFQVSQVTLTVSDGIAALPGDFAEAIGVYDAQGREYIGQTLQMQRTGRSYYALDGSLLRGPDGDVAIEYYAKIPTLTERMEASNWLLEQYPDAYLYGVSVEAAKYRRDVDSARALEAMREMAVSDIRADDSRARYSRARVRVKGPTP